MNDTVKSAYNAFLEHYKASENKDNNLLCLLVGGSTLYGLNNKNSDIDIRGVYALSRRSQVLGLGLYGKRSFESFVMNTDEVDAALHEFRHFIYLLSKTNTTVLDVLYAPEDAFIVNNSEYIAKIRKEPTRLVDTGQLYNSMKGYVHNEIRLMLGERSGKLGGKRKTNLDTYGYSYKNLVQVMRLSFAARKFLKLACIQLEFPIGIKTFTVF
jgi:predicted nucleotidyltransferase